jgi:hypothetical protein
MEIEEWGRKFVEDEWAAVKVQEWSLKVNS